jgi:hypothetical protein
MSGFTRYANAVRCECGEHRLSDATCEACGERQAVYGGVVCCDCRVTPPATETASENGKGQFCKEHSSWFCPCVAGWLYSTAARAEYLAGRWHGTDSGPRKSPAQRPVQGEPEQMELQ